MEGLPGGESGQHPEKEGKTGHRRPRELNIRIHPGPLSGYFSINELTPISYEQHINSDIRLLQQDHRIPHSSQAARASNLVSLKTGIKTDYGRLQAHRDKRPHSDRPQYNHLPLRGVHLHTRPSMSNEIIIIGTGMKRALTALHNEMGMSLLSGETRPPLPGPADYSAIPLLPCPFCGSKDVGLNSETKYGHGDSTSYSSVHCRTCYAHGPAKGYYGLPRDEDRLAAITAWNKPRI